MKKFIDFESKGPLGKVLDFVLGIQSAERVEDADLIISDSVEKTLGHLQRTDKKVVQVCTDKDRTLGHLVEDYPNRFRVVVLGERQGNLVEIAQAISEITST